MNDLCGVLEARLERSLEYPSLLNKNAKRHLDPNPELGEMEVEGVSECVNQFGRQKWSEEVICGFGRVIPNDENPASIASTTQGRTLSLYARMSLVPPGWLMSVKTNRLSASQHACTLMPIRE
jgi:hypothetical protein